jgi:hypothetical protein
MPRDYWSRASPPQIKVTFRADECNLYSLVESAMTPELQERRNMPSVFQPEALLRKACRQKGLPTDPVPAVCLLDPDGDLARHLKQSGRGRRHGAGPATTPN